MMADSDDQAAMSRLAERDPRWAAVVARDPAADGRFVYSVATTGVFCRPSCPSRLAGFGHVRYHSTCAEAEQAGFRPCRRCKPALARIAPEVGP